MLEGHNEGHNAVGFSCRNCCRNVMSVMSRYDQGHNGKTAGRCWLQCGRYEVITYYWVVVTRETTKNHARRVREARSLLTGVLSFGRVITR